MSATEEQKVLLELFKKFHVQASLSITEIREITAKVFVELEVSPVRCRRLACL
jgi:hypothetical protein